MRIAAAVTVIVAAFVSAAPAFAAETASFQVPLGAHPHDVAPGPDGIVWYTAQAQGALGRIDPATGKVEQISLGSESAPHGVIIGPDGAPWITDGGQNAIVRVDPKTRDVKKWTLPGNRAYSNLNTGIFDKRGIYWFTGQSGIYGRLDPSSGEMGVFDAPKGVGPYGIHATPDGVVYYASLAGSHIARIDAPTSNAVVIQPPTREQGARRVWSDSPSTAVP